MTTTQQPPSGVTRPIDRLRASGPAEILQVVPYLLGFQPKQSVVLMGLAPPRRQLVVTARLDLDAPADASGPWFVAARREGCDECLVVVYDEAIDGRPLLNAGRVQEWKTIAHRHSIAMTDALAVGERRWWSYLCDDNACCPDDGILLEASGRVAAAAVSYGLVAAPDRSALVAELAPDPTRIQAVCDAIDAMDPQQIGKFLGAPGSDSARRQRIQSLADVEQLLKECTERRSPSSAPLAARALVALSDVLVRDAMIASVPLRENSAVLAFWRDLARCAPDGLAAPPATMYALCAFAAGDGARANVGIVRALDDHPGYRMAELLDAAVSGGIKPGSSIPAMVQGAAKERAKLLRG